MGGAGVRRAKTTQKYYFDYSLMIIVIVLVCFGLVMLYSTSSYNAKLNFEDSAFYLKKQLIASGLGICAMLFVSNIDYHTFEKIALPAYICSIVLSILVLIIGDEYNGSKRWLSFGPISFQPSEFSKLAVIIFISYVISKVPKSMKKFSSMIKILIMVIPIIALVAKNNLSTAIIIFGIAAVLLFVASPKILPFVGLAGLGTGFVAIFLMTAGYRLERIKVWMDPENYDKGFQTIQGLYAIGSGGIFGKGLGESMQKLGFVPEAQNDMIFSIICEELGLFGAICVIILFMLLIWRFMIISTNADDLFGALLVAGIMAHISIQVILNVAVVTNSIPNTGITLPFISYGGTSVCFLLMEMGVALSVSKGIRFD